MTGWLDEMLGPIRAMVAGVLQTHRARWNFVDVAVAHDAVDNRMDLTTRMPADGARSGRVVRSNGTTWGASDSQWVELEPTDDFEMEPPSNHTITINRSDLVYDIRPGDPIRLFLRVGGPIHNDTANQIGAVFFGANLNSSQVDPWGLVWIRIIDDGGGNYHVELFNHYDQATGHKIGHTAQFSTSGGKPIVADNGSGLTGTVTMNAPTAGAVDIFVECYQYGIVSDMGPTLLTYDGPAIVAIGAEYLVGLAYGDRSRVRVRNVRIPGAWATGSTTLIFDNQSACRGYGKERIARVYAHTDGVASTYGKVNVAVNANKVITTDTYNGIQLADGDWHGSGYAINPVYARLEDGNEIEVTSTVGNAGNTDLDVVIETVLE